MKYNNELYEGKHEPMVTMEQFERVQSMSGMPTPSAPALLPFAYRGLINCGRCGSQVTAERHTNRYGYKYTYYHCSRKRRVDTFCEERSLTESNIDEAIQSILEQLDFPQEFLDAFVEEAASVMEERLAKWDANAQAVEGQLRGIDARLERLRSLLVDGTITDADYSNDRERLMRARAVLHEKAKRPSSAADCLEPFKTRVLSLKQWKNSFGTSSPTKSAVVRELFSNLC